MSSIASQEQAPDILVVVVTFNSARDIVRCLESLHRALDGRADCRVFLVDNASEDDTVVLARAHLGRAELICNERNLGFAAANNIAIDLALTTGARFVYLLNPDTVVEPDFLTRALEVAGEDSSIAAVQSLLLLESERDLIDSAGNCVHFLGFGYCGLHRQPLANAPGEPVEIAFASGAAMLLRVEALRRIGTLREDLGLFCEDLDLGWRLRMASYRTMLAPNSIVFHRHDFLRHLGKYELLERNRILVLSANYSAHALIALMPLLVLNELALLAIAVTQGWARQKLAAWIELLRPAAWRQLRIARRRAQALRSSRDREVVRGFTARMDFAGALAPLLRAVATPLLAVTWRLTRLFI